jgi:hypothetical protein
MPKFGWLNSQTKVTRLLPDFESVYWIEIDKNLLKFCIERLEQMRDILGTLWITTKEYWSTR